jgi:hypothetical protein
MKETPNEFAGQLDNVETLDSTLLTSPFQKSLGARILSGTSEIGHFRDHAIDETSALAGDNISAF